LAGLRSGLADRLGLSKAGCFAHFKARRRSLAVLREAGAHSRGQVVRAGGWPSPAGRAAGHALLPYLDWMRDGCVYSTVAQELDKLPEAGARGVPGRAAAVQETIVGRLASDTVDPQRSPEVVLHSSGWPWRQQR